MNKAEEKYASEEFPLAQVIHVLRKYWRVFVIGWLIGAAAGVAVIFLVAPAYRADVVAVSTAAANDTAGLGDLVRGLGGGLGGLIGSTLQNSGTRLQQDLALIRSRAFTLDFIRRQNLLPGLFPERWDRDAQAWLPRESWFGAPSEDLVPSDDEAFRRMDSRRQVVLTATSEIVTIRIEWPDANEAARLANEMVAAANQYARRRVAEESARSIEYLDQQLESAQVLGLREMLYGLYEEQVKRAMLAEVRDDFVLNVIDPAMPPERQIRPRPLLYTASGAAIGFLVALLIVALRSSRQGQNTRPERD